MHLTQHLVVAMLVKGSPVELVSKGALGVSRGWLRMTLIA